MLHTLTNRIEDRFIRRDGRVEGLSLHQMDDQARWRNGHTAHSLLYQTSQSAHGNVCSLLFLQEAGKLGNSRRPACQMDFEPEGREE